MKMYVGNLAFSVTNSQLEKLFSACGTVKSAQVITDRESGRSKGFGFVEMSSTSEMEDAIDKFNGYELDGRAIKVNKAKPREDRPARSRYFSVNDTRPVFRLY
jgi:RNA recognition motif-containing protein